MMHKLLYLQIDVILLNMDYYDECEPSFYVLLYQGVLFIRARIHYTKFVIHNMTRQYLLNSLYIWILKTI